MSEQIVRMVNRDQIVVPDDRVRQDFGDLTRLAQSITERGLIQPLVVFPLDSTGTHYQLIAGERRFRAISQTDLTEVPVRVYPRNVSSLELRRIENEENLFRLDLSFAERARLERDILKLEQEIYGKAQPGQTNGTGASVRTVAEKLGISTGKLSEDISLADAIDVFPEIEESRNRAEALRRLARLREQLVVEEVAKRRLDIADRTPENILRQSLVDSYIVGDAIEGLTQLPEGAYRLAEIDPPYGTDLGSKTYYTKELREGTGGKSEEKATLYTDLKPGEYEPFLRSVLTETYRVLAPDSFIILWYATSAKFGHDQLSRRLLEEVGFSVAGIPGFWVKNKGQNQNPALIMTNVVETFWYGWKGQPQLAKQGRNNVFAYGTTDNRIHLTERPISMMVDLLSVFVHPSDPIVCPFLGSGNTILAGNDLGCPTVGFDLDQRLKDQFILRVYDGMPGQYGRVG